MTARPKTPPLVAAVKREISTINKAVPGTSRSADAVLAVELARRVVGAVVVEDGVNVGDPLSARVSAARHLREVMAALHALVPTAASQPVDGLAEIRAARARRLAS